jgi:hypothetical protein
VSRDARHPVRGADAETASLPCKPRECVKRLGECGVNRGQLHTALRACLLISRKRLHRPGGETGPSPLGSALVHGTQGRCLGKFPGREMLLRPAKRCVSDGFANITFAPQHLHLFKHLFRIEGARFVKAHSLGALGDEILRWGFRSPDWMNLIMLWSPPLEGVQGACPARRAAAALRARHRHRKP